MSTVDNAEIIRSDPDPSSGSGKNGRLNHRTWTMIGYGFAGVVAIAVGVIVWAFQHPSGSVTGVAEAATLRATPAAAATYSPDDQTRDVRKAEAAATATAIPDPSGSHAPGSGGAAGGNTGGDPSATPTPTLADREQELRDASALDATARRLQDGSSAITGDAIVSGQGTAAGGPSPSPSPPQNAYMPPGPPAGFDPGSSPTPAPIGARPDVAASSDALSSPFKWREGDHVEVTLEPNIQSDRAGLVRLVVNAPLTDSDYGALVLMPPGTVILAKVVGADNVTHAIALSPTKLRIPPGDWIPFPGAVLSTDGNTGVIGRANDHRWPGIIIATIAGALSGLGGAITNVSGGVVVQQAQQRPPVWQELGAGAGQALLNGATQQIQQGANKPVSVSAPRAIRLEIQAYADVPLWPYCDAIYHPDSRECVALHYLQSRGKGPQ